MSVLFTKVKGLAFSTTAIERAVRIFCVGGLVLGLAASVRAEVLVLDEASMNTELEKVR